MAAAVPLLTHAQTRQQASAAVTGCVADCPRLVSLGATHGLEARRRLGAFSRRSHAPQCPVYDSSLDAARRLVARDGARALWRGTGASLAHAAPSVGLYLPAYDALQAAYADAGAPRAAPALAGASARALVSLAVGAPASSSLFRAHAPQPRSSWSARACRRAAPATASHPACARGWPPRWRSGAALARSGAASAPRSPETSPSPRSTGRRWSRCAPRCWRWSRGRTRPPQSSAQTCWRAAPPAQRRPPPPPPWTR